MNQMTEAEAGVPGEAGFKTKEVVMVRGGIERYLKTFPEVRRAIFLETLRQCDLTPDT